MLLLKVELSKYSHDKHDKCRINVRSKDTMTIDVCPYSQKELAAPYDVLPQNRCPIGDMIAMFLP